MNRQRGASLDFNLKLRVKRGHDHFWRVIRDLDRRGPWTVGDIDAHSSAQRANIHDFVRRLTKAGFVEWTGEKRGERRYAEPTYRMIRDSREAPRVRRDGTVLRETINETMWRSMKMLRRFTLAELRAHLGRPVPAITVCRYARHLADVGVLTELRRGGGRTQAIYHLARNLGGNAPRILRAHIVFDPNSNTIIGTAEASETP